MKNECISPTCVKLPPMLRQEAQKIVEEGYFKTLSELMITGTRQVIQEYHPSKVVLETRHAKQEIWDEFLHKAQGNEEKAIGFFFDEIKNRQIKRYKS